MSGFSGYNDSESITLVFFGTPEIALSAFRELANDFNFNVLALVTQAPKPSGRGKKIVENQLKKFAISKNIEVFEPLKIAMEQEVIEKLRALKPDFFVTFAFGQILSQEVLDIPKCGTINLHASLLPKYRGANPIRQAILDGENKTGVTTMLTTLELDSGDICLQEEIELDIHTSSLDLTNKISEISSDLIKKTLLGLKCNKIKPIEQNHANATFTKKTKKEDKVINWSESSYKIHNKIRALVDNFTCQTTYCGKILKILKTHLDRRTGQSGSVLEISKHGIIVGCGEGAILIQNVKPEGKGEMSAYNWSLGARLKVGDKFE